MKEAWGDSAKIIRDLLSLHAALYVQYWATSKAPSLAFSPHLSRAQTLACTPHPVVSGLHSREAEGRVLCVYPFLPDTVEGTSVKRPRGGVPWKLMGRLIGIDTLCVNVSDSLKQDVLLKLGRSIVRKRDLQGVLSGKKS